MITYIQDDQKFSVHLTITVQITGAQRTFYHPVQGSAVLIASFLNFERCRCTVRVPCLNRIIIT
jgi:hypothetical protein